VFRWSDWKTHKNLERGFLMKDEWQPFLVAVILCVCAGAGFGFIQSPSAPWLPYEMAVNNQWPDGQSYTYHDQHDSKSDQQSVTPPANLGKLQTDRNGCYQDEKQGECAGRIIQERMAGFYPLLSVAAFLQALGAIGVIVLVIRQLKVARAQLRAYVLLENAWARKVHDRPNVRYVVFKIKNSGTTPAHKTRVIAISDAVKYPITKLPTPVAGDYYGTLGPNGDFVDCDTDFVTGFTEEDIEGERMAIVLVGKITYEDAFNRKWWSDFCYIITGEEADDGEMGIHDTGNDSV
jgi:hypothetical protein